MFENQHSSWISRNCSFPAYCKKSFKSNCAMSCCDIYSTYTCFVGSIMFNYLSSWFVPNFVGSPQGLTLGACRDATKEYKSAWQRILRFGVDFDRLERWIKPDESVWYIMIYIYCIYNHIYIYIQTYIYIYIYSPISQKEWFCVYLFPKVWKMASRARTWCFIDILVRALLGYPNMLI